MIALGIQRDPIGYENVQKGGQSQGSSLLSSSIGVSPPWGTRPIYHYYMELGVNN